MKKRLDIVKRLETLTDIRGVVSALKTLAQAEIARSARGIERQRAMVSGLDLLLGEVLSESPTQKYYNSSEKPGILVLIGAERGFCGGFNTALGGAAERAAKEVRPVIVVGQRLATHLQQSRPAESSWILLRGPGSIEEVELVMAELLEAIAKLLEDPKSGPAEAIAIAFNHDLNGMATLQTATPFIRQWEKKKEVRTPLELNLQPREFLEQLLRHYLAFFIQTALLESYLAENRQRYLHLEGGLARLDRNYDELKLRSRKLRQEEITQEIEVILLSSSQFIILE